MRSAEWYATVVQRNFNTRMVERWYHVRVDEFDRGIEDIILRAACGRYRSKVSEPFEDNAPTWDELEDWRKNEFQPSSWYEVYDEDAPGAHDELDWEIQQGKYRKGEARQ